MTDRALAPLERVARALEWLGDAILFFGAGILPLYIDEPAVEAEPLRPTEDVDALVRMAGLVFGSVAALEAELRDRGWRPDLRVRRQNLFAYVSPDGVAVDFVFDSTLPSTDWPVRALETRERRTLPSGLAIQVPSPALYLLCKVAASRSRHRWEGAYESHDLEDVAVLLAGCTALAESVDTAPEDARRALREWAKEVDTRRTVYGSQAYACLEGNWPRGADIDQLDKWLERLAAA